MGHIIGKDGVKPDPKKVQSVVDWPCPTCLREVLQFLGLTNFFIKYIQGYANLTRPLTDLSKKNVSFVWSNECKVAFSALKHALSSAPVLALPDPAMPFELVCDASGFGLGAVLMQQQRPVAYYSSKMTSAERNRVVLSRSCWLLLKLCASFAATSYQVSSLLWLLTTSLTLSCKHNLLCLGVKRAGVSICSAFASIGCIGLVVTMLLTL